MGNNKEGVQRIKEKYGEDHFKKIGRLGGETKGLKGFAANRELAREAGRRGGLISRIKRPRKSKEN